MRSAYEIWQIVWEYGHTFAGLIILPLTDPWVRRLLTHWKCVPGKAPEKLLRHEHIDSILAKVTAINDSSKIWSANTEALDKRLSDCEKAITEALDKRLSDCEKAIDKRFSHIEGVINNRTDNLDRAIRDLMGLFKNLSNPVDSAILAPGQPIFKRLHKLRISEQEPVEEVLSKCLDMIDNAAKTITSHEKEIQLLQGKIDTTVQNLSSKGDC